MPEQTETQEELVCQIRHLAMILAKISGPDSDICGTCAMDVEEILTNPDSDFGEPHPEDQEYLEWRNRHEAEVAEMSLEAN